MREPKDGRLEEGDLSLIVLAAAWRRRATLGLAGERQLDELLRELRNHLFDQDLTLESILERAGAGGRSVWSSFRAAVGRPAWTYLREARMETAAILLLRTSFDVKQIGPLVGYASLGKLDAEEAWELMAYLERYRAVLLSDTL